MPPKPAWAEYQDDVAKIFSGLGFRVRTNERIQGARGGHDIDVTARMKVAGVEQLWLIECKRWTRSVPKERVLTLLGVVADIGADRGFMFSESGYQAGAFRVAANMNVTLTSLEDFRVNAASELVDLQIRALDSKLERLARAYESLWDLSEEERRAAFSNYVGPPDIAGRPSCASVTARISQMREALESARYGKWPVYYYALDHDDRGLITVLALDGLLPIIELTLDTCQKIHDHMLNPDPSVENWRDLQAPELTELLALIRRGQ
ncbi:restriction endonuclease [Frankia sp. CiP3]|uniref:restriction endonuclease n=1 Tax=Frankia sp. CiP3 TaxID=2880971 RepID=UPI001EF3DD68|nr:restriction endonuclease [Frankia sp. CiP3]